MYVCTICNLIIDIQLLIIRKKHYETSIKIGIIYK